MKIISILTQEHPRTRSGYVCGVDFFTGSPRRTDSIVLVGDVNVVHLTGNTRPLLLNTLPTTRRSYTQQDENSKWSWCRRSRIPCLAPCHIGHGIQRRMRYPRPILLPTHTTKTRHTACFIILNKPRPVIRANQVNPIRGSVIVPFPRQVRPNIPTCPTQELNHRTPRFISTNQSHFVGCSSASAFVTNEILRLPHTRGIEPVSGNAMLTRCCYTYPWNVRDLSSRTHYRGRLQSGSSGIR